MWLQGWISGTRRGRDGSRRAASLRARALPRLLRAAIAVPLALGTPAAHAICLRGPSAQLAALGHLVGKNPQEALDRTAARLSGAHRLRLSQNEIAWLHAIRAGAYNNLSLPDDARRAALQGMKAVPDVRDPAHVESLNEWAYNGFDTAQIDQSIPIVTRARKAQRPGSAADVCLQATLGHLLRMRDQSDLAIVNLMEAYRASMRPGLEEQRVSVAAAFSILMRYASDWDQALALNQEGIDWSIAKGRTQDLADFRFKGGWILVKQGRYEQALEQFRLARATRGEFDARKAAGDVVNGAYLDLLTCEALVALRRYVPARRACVAAERVFAAHRDASAGQARLLLARIALGQNRPREALDGLTSLSNGSAAQSASVNVARLHRHRAEALAALGRPAEAYADLARYVALNARWSETEGARQAAFLRARFETDRQADRNRSLQAALGFARERAGEQRRRTITLLVFAGIVIVLLGQIVLADRRNRRRLLLIASSDGLTGLLNRKWTAERGTALLAQAQRQKTPLSVALIDLDHFKGVNDTYGHAAGDEVLRHFADAARGAVRANDVLGRWGGEEFLLIMPDTPDIGAWEAVERLRTIAAGMGLSFTKDYTIRFSAGVVGRSAEDTLDELVAKADLALYRAKDGGRNTTCVHGFAAADGDRAGTVAPLPAHEPASGALLLPGITHV